MHKSDQGRVVRLILKPPSPASPLISSPISTPTFVPSRWPTLFHFPLTTLSFCKESICSLLISPPAVPFLCFHRTLISLDDFRLGMCSWRGCKSFYYFTPILLLFLIWHITRVRAAQRSFKAWVSGLLDLSRGFFRYSNCNKTMITTSPGPLCVMKKAVLVSIPDSEVACSASLRIFHTIHSKLCF